ncbi:hypothetical protein TRVA0_047S00914 [Trichomonascus vanleenenianus]|uniref:uncharacterized protein n=1 Tax=Trichomonascus vanleenenianus TaxID=2268995 RepID=UPI003ECB0AF7
MEVREHEELLSVEDGPYHPQSKGLVECVDYFRPVEGHPLRPNSAFLSSVITSSSSSSGDSFKQLIHSSPISSSSSPVLPKRSNLIDLLNPSHEDDAGPTVKKIKKSESKEDLRTAPNLPQARLNPASLQLEALESKPYRPLPKTIAELFEEAKQYDAARGTRIYNALQQVQSRSISHTYSNSRANLCGIARKRLIKLDDGKTKSQGRPFAKDMMVYVRVSPDMPALLKVANNKTMAQDAHLLRFADLSKDPPAKRRKRSSSPSLSPTPELNEEAPMFETRQGMRVWHYTRIREAIEYATGVREYTYVQVIRASSEQSERDRQLCERQKVMKMVTIEPPPSPVHNVVYLKSEVCYPRYKSGMTIHIVPYKTNNKFAYYTTDILKDMEELMGIDPKCTFYCDPTMLGLSETPMELRYEARLLCHQVSLIEPKEHGAISDAHHELNKVMREEYRALRRRLGHAESEHSAAGALLWMVKHPKRKPG